MLEHGITLHPGKFVFGAPSASYCGFKVSADGYRVDDHLVKALSSFPVPTNRTDIRSFCGLVQQFQAFSPHLTEMLSPIRSLLSPKAAFFWEAPQQEAFSQVPVVRELTTPRILANYTLQVFPCGWKLTPHSPRAWAWPSGRSSLRVNGESSNVVPGTSLLQSHATPPQRSNCSQSSGPSTRRTSILQAPTLSWWSTIVPLSPSSTPRRSTNCRPRAWST